MFPILIIIAVLIAFYIYATKNHDYWLKRNVRHDKPIPFFGNHFKNQFGLCSSTELSLDYYNRFKNEKVVGYYRGRTPELIIRDPEIVKRIMTVDFPYFYKRGLGRNPEVETLLYSLFHVEGDIWKLLRQRLTPTFTTAKLKAMFPLIVKCAEKLQVVCQGTIDKGGVCDVREMMARFTTEFIGACGFGIEMDTINNENSLFRELGKLIFTRPLRNIILTSCWELIPESHGFYSVMDPKITMMMTDIVQKIRKQRNFKPSGRNDFIDLLLELEDKGTIKGESIEKMNSDGSPVEVEVEMELKHMVAQVFVFFAAGFETSSATTSYTLHELAFHPEIQTKIQEQIDQVLAKYNDKLCYDAVSEMTLLELAFKESLRKFPSLGVLNRVCTRQYTIPELNITIDPGVRILIPVQALQKDEKYFKNPTEFKPERFANRTNENKFVYLPFGEGPRACIGLRLGQMQSLAGLAAVLQKFSVEPAEITRRELVIEPKSNVVQAVRGGIPLRLRPRKSKAA